MARPKEVKGDTGIVIFLEGRGTQIVGQPIQNGLSKGNRRAVFTVKTIDGDIPAIIASGIITIPYRVSSAVDVVNGKGVSVLHG